MTAHHTTSPRAQRPLTGRTVLIWLLAFFGVIFAVNITITKLAIDTLPGTEVDSAYRSSLAYNDEIKAARAQETRAWRADARVERDPAGRASIRIEMRDQAGAPLSGLGLSARLARPTDKRADRLVPIREPQAGLYRGEADDVAAGQWDLVIEAERGNERVFTSRNRIRLN